MGKGSTIFQSRVIGFEVGYRGVVFYKELGKNENRKKTMVIKGSFYNRIGMEMDACFGGEGWKGRIRDKGESG